MVAGSSGDRRVWGDCASIWTHANGSPFRFLRALLTAGRYTQSPLRRSQEAGIHTFVRWATIAASLTSCSPLSLNRTHKDTVHHSEKRLITNLKISNVDLIMGLMTIENLYFSMQIACKFALFFRGAKRGEHLLVCSCSKLCTDKRNLIVLNVMGISIECTVAEI